MELYGIIHQHYNMNPCEKKVNKKENKKENKKCVDKITGV